MVDDDEEVSLTLKREFGEEALNSLQASAEERSKLEDELKRFFEHGTEIYKGGRLKLLPDQHVVLCNYCLYYNH